ncbi:MBL fold metallo-hydrolase RNA specificity domain-containing protein [Parasphaerochaeta coccoides]|uniref:Beta-lactamase domain protein n=1 Tax=Parasphaerochaeta coccoides (strain ATCC BAA-1237 / DSM 17374 / SPN1) TaxID=760011 RepID=F4GLK7_PARC1|nr:MBL fold metallo-hydrolase [Parasphaerochaeta coccoides]AEC01977.1 beta-lactamase domain protein [Parasphaerochaeta coccoides DSM 17374]
MKISFYGAARHVTGSCFMLSADGMNILIDCGLAQGTDERVQGDELPFKAETVDVMLLTHAHIDHSGRIPLLVKEGFSGAIYATEATRNLCEIMLADSAHIQQMETEWQNRKQRRAGKPAVEPLYTTADAEKSMELFRECRYGEVMELSAHVSVRFIDAGHLLGSASMEITVKENGEERIFVFSGDIGNFDQPLIQDPQYPKKADYVIVESTYGDRLHGGSGSGKPGSQKATTIARAQDLADIIAETFAQGGNVVIPAFAVGRTQEILYFLRYMLDHKLNGLQDVPVFVDSPLSVKATRIFATSMEFFDDEALELAKKGHNPILFPSLVTITDANDSKALNFRNEPAVIISSSGMCEAGRIKHHLKHNLWRPESCIVFSGYQAEGTLGRSILDGAQHVTIFGEQIDVKARVRKLEGVSGHADQNGLLRWLSAFADAPRHVFVVHGDSDVAPWFAGFLKAELGLRAYAPKFLESFDVLADKLPETPPSEFTSPQLRILAEAFTALSAGQKDVESIIQRLAKAADAPGLLTNRKKTLRLANAIQRLTSDLEYLKIKWDKDASA